MQSKVRYIRRPELIAKTGLGATTIYQLEKSGEFPQHFMLAPRCAVWDEGQVERWMERRRADNLKAASIPDVHQRKDIKEKQKKISIVDEDLLRKVADGIDDTIAPTSDEHFWMFSTEQIVEFVRAIKAA